MKQLTCEMCGSTDLLKQEGVFVCQSCGTKYSVEEAKKMMVEGTVEVTGTVKVDTTSKLSNLYEIARRARDDNNTEKAAQYYDMILQEDPMSWEASFYTTYYSAMQTNIAGISSAAIKVSNCIDTVLKLIKNNVPEEKQYFAVFEVETQVTVIAAMLCNAAENHYNGIDYQIRDKYKQEYIDRLCAARDLMYNMGNQIENILGNGEKFGVITASAWKDGITMHKKILGLLILKESDQKVIDSYSQKIGKYDPEYLNQHDKATIPARIEKIDRNIKSLKKGSNMVTIGSTLAGFLAVLCAIYRIYFALWLRPYLDEPFSPLAFVMAAVLVACAVILRKPMTSPQLWRKGVGIAVIAYSIYVLVMCMLRYESDYWYLNLDGLGPVVILTLILCGILLLRQKFDSAKAAANERQLENLEKEKADLEKKLADLG